MTILDRLCILVVLVPMLCLAASGEADVDVQRILDAIESAQDEATVRSKMSELAALDSPAAARAFARQLDRIVIDSENPVPYLNMLFDFSETGDIRDSLVPALERMLASDVDRWEHLYLSAALAKFGAEEKVQWLIDEYIQAKAGGSATLGYSMTLYELLCRTDQDRAVRYVVDEAVESTDPTLKLGAEYCLRERGNPAALEIMRRWDAIQTGDFDLIVAEHYLKSIIEFGDKRDAEFIKWIDANAADVFHPEDRKSRIDPLMKAATARIEQKRRSQLPMAAILLLLILGAAFVSFVAFRRKRKPNP